MRYDNVTPYNQMNNLFLDCKYLFWRKTAQALYYTGCRAGELIQIKRKDVTINKDDPMFIEVKIMTEKNTHSPYRYIPINIEAEPGTKQLFLQDKEPDALLFPKYKKDIKMTSHLRVMRRNFNKYWSVAPHYFRHCRLTHMVTQFDFNDQELVKYAGWTDSKPAKWYISLKTTDLQRKMGGKL